MELIDTGTLIDIYVRYCTKQELQLRPAYCQILLDIKIHQSITFLLILIICPMYSYVLYYNIEKSGFNSVSAALVFRLW